MNNELSKIIGERINILLANQDKKQKELAEYLGVTDNTISYFVSGKRMPNTAQIKKIVEFFNVSADYLLCLSDVATTNKDIKFICDYTGLSEKSVDVLHFYRNVEMIYPTVNKLLESETSSLLQELGYMCSDMPKDKLKEKCEKNNIDFEKLENIIETKSYECLQVVSTIEQYLNMKKTTSEKILSISQSGKIISLSETDLEYTNKLTFDDLISIKTIKQSEIVEKVLLDNMIEKIKQLKKCGENNVNNP